MRSTRASHSQVRTVPAAAAASYPRRSPERVQARRPRFLMCEPEHYDVHFMFNPWMPYTERVDRRKAFRQWRSLVGAIEQAGAEIEYLPASRVSPAQVFTADGAVIYGEKRALILRNDGPRGYWEPRAFADWLLSRGFITEALPPRYRLDGGNILRLHDGSFAAGLKPGATGESERYLSKLLRFVGAGSLTGIGLIERKFLHLDMVVGRVGDSAYLVYEGGLFGGKAALARTPLERMPLISVMEEDAQNFACNGITIGNVFVTGPVSDGLARQIRAIGYEVERIDLSEFYKAGGGAKCLTLPLRESRWRAEEATIDKREVKRRSPQVVC